MFPARAGMTGDPPLLTERASGSRAPSQSLLQTAAGGRSPVPAFKATLAAERGFRGRLGMYQRLHPLVMYHSIGLLARWLLTRVGGVADGTACREHLPGAGQAAASREEEGAGFSSASGWLSKSSGRKTPLWRRRPTLADV